MHTRFSILFLIILHLLYTYSENIESNKYLPFVLVKHKGKLELPNQLVKANTDEFLGFTGDTQFSKDGSKDQMFFCPLHTRKELDNIAKVNDIIRLYYSLKNKYGSEGVSRNCLFRKKFKKGEALRCGDDAQGSMKPVRSGELGGKTEEDCGPYKLGTLYKLIFEICSPVTIFQRWMGFYSVDPEIKKFKRNSPFNYKHFTVYEICINPWESKTVYTKHTLKSVNLLYDKRLEHEKDIEHSRKFPSYYYDNGQLKNSDGITHSSAEKESYTDESSDLYFAQALVSPNDMITALLKKHTFSPHNVKPMHQHLQPVWNYIEELIRENFRNRKTEHEVTIYTGAFTSLIPQSKVSENRADKNEVPLVWVKLLYEKKDLPIDQTLVIIMKNDNKFENVAFNRDPDLTTLCTEDHCQFFKNDKQEKFGRLVYKIRCCPFNKEINTAFFDINFIYGNGLLHINNFTDREKYSDETI